MPAQGPGATAFDIGHRPPVAGQHRIFKFGPVGRPITAEDLSQTGHGKSSINSLMVSVAIVSALAVKWV
jgi:hypothetical protein